MISIAELQISTNRSTPLSVNLITNPFGIRIRYSIRPETMLNPVFLLSLLASAFVALPFAASWPLNSTMMAMNGTEHILESRADPATCKGKALSSFCRSVDIDCDGALDVCIYFFSLQMMFSFAPLFSFLVVLWV